MYQGRQPLTVLLQKRRVEFGHDHRLTVGLHAKRLAASVPCARAIGVAVGTGNHLDGGDFHGVT
jgi:hypothetical protein